MPTGDQLSVSLSADPNPDYTNPNSPAYDSNDVDGNLWADAVMVHPLWPTVTIRAGQSDQPYTAEGRLVAILAADQHSRGGRQRQPREDSS